MVAGLVVGYARVSNREQGFTNALEQQKARLDAYGVTNIMADIESGRKDDREQFEALGQLIKQRAVTKVVATRCDRLSRSVITLRKFFAECERYGVEVVVLDDAIDTTTAAGRFHLNMIAALAEMESDRLSERVRHGQDYHRQLGRPYHACFGYVKVGQKFELDRSPVLCELSTGQEWSKADLARERIELVMKLGSLIKALRAYNERFGIAWRSWQSAGNSKPRGLVSLSNSGLGTWLCNPILRGHIAYGRSQRGRVKDEDSWELRLNQHEALMSEGEWAQIRDLMVSNAKKTGGMYGGASNRPFLGLVRCEECGSVCSYNFHQLRTDKMARKYRYACRRYQVERSCGQGKGVREEVIRGAVIEKLTQRAKDILKIEVGNQESPPESEEIQVLKGQLRELLKIRPQSSAIYQAIQETKRQISQVEVKRVVGEKQMREKMGELEVIFADPAYWYWLEERLTPAEVKANYRKWVKAIWMQDGAVSRVELWV